MKGNRMNLRDRVTILLDLPVVRHGIIGVILFNALILGLETSAMAMERWGGALVFLDRLCLAIFVVELAAGNGADREALSAALAGAVLKARLKAECDAAFGKGVFGSPYMIVDGEPFFGVDRLPQIERWLSSGGF